MIHAWRRSPPYFKDHLFCFIALSGMLGVRLVEIKVAKRFFPFLPQGVFRLFLAPFWCLLVALLAASSSAAAAHT
jgi:hypothetical protein